MARGRRECCWPCEHVSMSGFTSGVRQRGQRLKSFLHVSTRTWPLCLQTLSWHSAHTERGEASEMLRNRPKANSIPSRLSPGPPLLRLDNLLECCVRRFRYRKLRIIKKRKLRATVRTAPVLEGRGETESSFVDAALIAQVKALIVEKQEIKPAVKFSAETDDFINSLYSCSCGSWKQNCNICKVSCKKQHMCIVMLSLCTAPFIVGMFIC